MRRRNVERVAAIANIVYCTWFMVKDVIETIIDLATKLR